MTGRSVRRIVVAVASAGALVGALGLGSIAVAAGHDVAIAGFAFSPETIKVALGDTITWTNADAAGHTATADDGSFDTGTIGSGSSKSATFSTAGTFAYHCRIHRAMTGTVVVVDAAAPATDAPARAVARSDGTPWLLAGLVAALGLLLGLRRFAARV